MTRKAGYGAAMLLALLASPSVTVSKLSAQVPSRIESVNGRDAVTGEILVKFRGSSGAATFAEMRAAGDIDSMQPIGRGGLHLLRSRSMSAKELLARFATRGDVLYAEPNYIVHALSDPNDPQFPQLWGLENTGQAVNGGLPGTPGADIHATQAWDVSFGSRSQVVAIVDTGIDYTHPDLVANLWSAPTAFAVTIGGATIVCPAGSHGFNAIALTCNPMDDHEHGTHVAGTIGASGQNGIGVVGVNWVTQLMAIKFIDATGSGTLADAINGLEFAIQVKQLFAATGAANVRVLSNSWGSTDFSQALLDEIQATNDADMLFVAAAGNNGISSDILPTYPGSYDSPNIVAVAATDNTDARAWFSNYSPTLVHLGAPGVDVLSTVLGHDYAFLSGTSMATPHVSGAAALVLSRCQLDTAALKDTLLSTVEPVASLESITVTGGRLDVNSAIRSCVGPPDAPAALTATSGDGQAALHWSGGAGALSFNVKRSLTAGGPYTIVASGIKAKSYVDASVINDTTYYYTVSATNTFGDSGDSNEASVTPKVQADLVVSALTVPLSAGAQALLTLSETTRNQGAGTANPTTTRFYLSRSSAIDSTAVLLDGVHAVPALPPGASSTSTVSVTIPDVPVGIYYIVAQADADNLENETQESNNTLVRLTLVGPDLVVSALTGPATVAPGGSIVVTDTVKNQGGGSAGASTTRFYLSTDPMLDAGDLLLADNRSVPLLAAGASNSGSTTLLIPASITTATYYLIATADADHAVAETQESNNIALKTLQVGGDLVVSTLTVPAKAGAGLSILVSDTTTNQGAGTVPSSTTRFYLSISPLLDASAVRLTAGRAVPSLTAGASSSGSTTLQIPSTIATGNYYVIAKADDDGVVAETQEANNATPRVVAVGGDLIVSALISPALAGAGAAIVVSDTVKNQGGGAVGASTTRFYLSSDGSLDASDLLLAGARNVPALAPDDSSTGSTSLTIPASVTAGTYYLIAKADADGVVVETQEANNIAIRSLQIGGDLIVSTLTVPTAAASGSIIQVSDTTKNQGTGGVPASTTRFYLSISSVIDGSTIQLAESRSIPDLAAGSSSSGTTSVTIPATVATGTYYLIAKADGDNVVPETQEANNTTSRVVAIGGDLVVSIASAPSAVAAGDSIVVSDTVKNQGAGAVGGSTTRYYLSRDFALDATDLVLSGGRGVPGLAPSASSTGSTTVVVPPSVAVGTWILIAKADADNVVPEAQEANNTALKIVQVGGDLVVSALTAPSRGGAGLSIVVTDTTTNQGAGMLPASTTRFYLSSSPVLDASAVLLAGGRTVPPLSTSASSSGSTTLTIPPNMATGGFYLIAKADDDGTVTETQEANNTTARVISIGGDLVVSTLTTPSQAVAGTAIVLSDTVKNQGGGPVGASTTRFYLSTNATWEASDLLLSGSRSVPALDVDNTSTGSTTVTLPSGLAAGTYYLIAKADADNAVAESQEINNTIPRTIAIMPN